MSEEYPSTPKLEEIAARALLFQRYVFRRAWGTYYAVWAAAFAGFIFGSYLPLQSIIPGSYYWISYALFYGGIGWGAGIITGLIFRNAHRTLFLRRAIANSTQFTERRYALMWIWWIGFYILALFAFSYFQSGALTILYAMLFSVEIFIYYALRFAFQSRIPFEGKIALISYGFAVVFSFLASLFTSDARLFGIVWGSTIALWLFSSLYALLRSSDELVDLIF